MNSIVFTNAKNNSLSCSYNGKPLHSMYNPQNEAERFIQLLECNFVPKVICIIEPCISYCVEPLRKKYSNCKIICIRHQTVFSQFDNLFDKVFYFEDSINFENQFFDYLGEELICSTFFINWQNSSNIFINETTRIWTSLKNILEKASTILYTHDVFAKRWFLNSVKILKNSNTIGTIKKIESPIVIACSGPSLQNCFRTLEKNRKKIFLIAVSSALASLISNNIFPDLVISTDGGFWAKKHLDPLLKYDIPLAICQEANVNPKILNNRTIIPLLYNDGIECNLFIPYIKNPFFAQRNGTVSGTASELALEITDGLVYAFGLDLCSSKGPQHTKPNLNEPYNSLKDFRLTPAEYRNTRTRFNSQSLKIYHNWFESRTESKWNRFYRVSKAGDLDKNNKLGKIRDIDISEFEIQLKNIKETSYEIEKYTKKDNKDLNLIIKNLINSENWIKNIFPMDYLTYQKMQDDSQKQQKLNEIITKNDDFIKKIQRVIRG